MQQSNFNYFHNQFHFFKELPANTSAHYSTSHNSFIRTGAFFSFMPGVQSAANLYKGHTGNQLVHDLNDLTRRLHEELNQRLVYVYEHFEECDEAINEIKTLQEEFQQALTGNQNGGILGLRASQNEEDTRIKIDQFVRRTNAIMSLALEHLIMEQRAKVSSLDTSEQGLMQSIAEIEALHSLNRVLPDDLLKSMQMQEQEIEDSENITFMKMAMFSISLHYNAFMNKAASEWDWWNKIEVPQSDVRIFLGALPIARKLPFTSTYVSSDLETLTREQNIGAVLSVVEPFEMNTAGYMLTPITATQWREAKVKQKQLATEDFQTMSVENIEKGVAFIHKQTQKGKSVYIHCKAGRGRSALVLTCYLIKHHGFTAQDAIQHIQKYRPQAKLEKAKMDTAQEFEKKYS